MIDLCKRCVVCRRAQIGKMQVETVDTSHKSSLDNERTCSVCDFVYIILNTPNLVIEKVTNDSFVVFVTLACIGQTCNISIFGGLWCDPNPDPRQRAWMVDSQSQYFLAADIETSASKRAGVP